MSDLVEQVERAIRTRALFRKGQPLLVAVSGGLDSMVLLRVLHELSKTYAWRLTVAHLNHGLRGRSSDADERLVLKVSQELNVPTVVEHADVRGVSKAGKLSLEMGARKVRHEFLARAAERFEIQSIALAHHADDQCESFFLRLLRGSGSEGLAGMKWQNPSPCNADIRLVRPLLEQSKASLRDYAAQIGIDFHEDASNSCFDIRRNRIRHELLPLLERNYQSSLRSILWRTMDILAAEAQFVGDAARKWLESRDRESFDALPMALQRRCIQLQLIEEGLVPEYDLVEELRLKRDKPMCVAKATPDECGTDYGPIGVSVSRDSDGMLHLRSVHPSRFSNGCVKLDLKGAGGEIEFAGLALRWQVVSRRGASRPSGGATQEWFDADRVGSRVLLRHWRRGDRFQPIGMEKPVKLQDVFINQKVPRERRHELVIATTTHGEPFWVEGLRIAERFKLAKTTNRRLHWMWRRV